MEKGHYQKLDLEDRIKQLEKTVKQLESKIKALYTRTQYCLDQLPGSK